MVHANGSSIEEKIRNVPSTWRSLGGWVERPKDLRPELEGDLTADVVVVGAGFAGLSTALELKALGADVVVLEREFAGFGASGRNAGYLVGAGGLDYGAITQALGRERAKAIVTFFEDSVAYVERKLGEYGIDCDYSGSGLIGAAVHPSQEKMLHAKLAVGADLGVPAKFLDSAEMRARGIPPAFLCGTLIGGGILDPGKYVSGLRRAALGAGVRLYENTALLSFQAGPTIRCRTAKGSVSARHLVLATNADTPQLGVLKRKVTPVRVSAIETQPLSMPQLESLGWRNREGITTRHLVMESHRLTARNTVVVTTKHLGYEFGSQTPNVPHNEAYRALASVFYQRFPTLRDVAVQACWSGYISTTDDGLPTVGAEGPGGNILYAAGCNGHGIGGQSHTGKVLAEHIRGAASPAWAALQHETPAGLPEPLRWFTMRSKFGAAHRLDDQLNRTLRAPVAR